MKNNESEVTEYMDQMNVTGCIVTYNNGSIISGCIESLIKFTKNVPLQLYVSDNNSTDGTVELLQKVYPEVKVICNKKNLGFGQGHNRVLDYIHSKYHVVINPDVIIDMDVISTLVDYMERHPEVGMISPKVLNLDGSQQFLPKKDPCIRFVILSKFKPFKNYRKKYTMEGVHFHGPTEVESCSGSFFVIRTEIFKRLKGFDKRFFMYYEDADLSRRVRKEAKLIFYPECYIFHGWKRANTKSIKGIGIFLKSMIQYFIKWK